ncbi:30S ribosomal protein S6 [Candidatus Hepatincolaceae symbiont of Richtersius coronifer]
MAYYEHVYMVRGDLSVNQIEELNKKYKDLIESFKGTITKTEYWGLKGLAYRVNKNKKAHYCLLNLDVSFEGLKELQRSMSINESILRFLSIKADKLDNTPSIMMKQNRPYHQKNEMKDSAE